MKRTFSTVLENSRVRIRVARVLIRADGRSGLYRKLAQYPVKVIDRVTLLYAIRLLISFIHYVMKTLLSRHKRAYLLRFGPDVLALVQASTAYQQSKNSALRETTQAMLLAGDLARASLNCQTAISMDSTRPEAFFDMATVFYLQGKYGNSCSAYETGLNLLEKEKAKRGLNLLNIKLLDEKWGNIGHIALFDVIVKLSTLGHLSPQKRVLFMRPQECANSCYLSYWERYLNTVALPDDRAYRCLRDTVGYLIEEHVSMFQMREGFLNLYAAWNLAEDLWRAEKRPPLLELAEVDRERGEEVLKQWGIRGNTWFVGLHVREGDSRISRSGPNSNISTYLPAIKAITSRGGWVIRMGHPGMKPLPVLPKVIDYANSAYKSDWMDVFLWATCKYFIGTSSGPLSVPATFGRPVLLTNACAVGLNPNLSDSMMIPKLFYDSDKERLLTFQEMLDSPMGWTVSRAIEDHGVTLVDNLPEDIELAVIEMLDNLEDGGRKNSELSDLQLQFNNLRKSFGNTGQMTISETFAKKHCNLL